MRIRLLGLDATISLTPSAQPSAVVLTALASADDETRDVLAGDPICQIGIANGTARGAHIIPDRPSPGFLRLLRDLGIAEPVGGFTNGLPILRLSQDLS